MEIFEKGKKFLSFLFAMHELNLKYGYEENKKRDLQTSKNLTLFCDIMHARYKKYLMIFFSKKENLV